MAEKLGRTVAELRQTMSSDEYQEWVAFHTYRNALQNMREVK